MVRLQTQLEADGNTSILIVTTRPLNRRVLASSVADKLLNADPGLHRGVLDVMNMQADGLRDGLACTAAPQEAQRQPSTVATAELTDPSAGQVVQQGISRRHLSGQAANADIVSRWKSLRLRHTATNAELKGYLERRGLQYNATSKPALLARVAAELTKDHPDGETPFDSDRHNRCKL